MINLAEKVSQLEKKITDLEKKSSSRLEEIILNSNFKVLCFYGPADGTNNLLHAFDDSIFLNRSMLIKALKIFPYYQFATNDIEFSDGTVENMAADLRVQRVIDTYQGATAAFFNLLVNRAPIIFNQGSVMVNLLPSDYEFDNGYELIENINSIDINAFFEQADPSGGGVTNPLLKVYLECYIF